MAKKKKSTFSRVVSWLHLWPSLVASLIVIFVCLTGSIMVFCDEIIDLFNHDALYVKEVKANRLPADQLLKIVEETYPERRSPSYMVIYKDPSRTVKYNSYDKEKGLRFVYQDPYTGNIVKDDGTIYFFYINAHLHNSLMLGKTGEWIVDISVIIFLIGLVTGLILWWPKKWNKKTANLSFTIRWKAKFKRLNYDIHNVLGFYSLSLTLVLTVTGLIIAFHPLADATIEIFGGDTSDEWEADYLPPKDSAIQIAALEPVVQQYMDDYQDIEALQVLTYLLHREGFYMIHAASWVGLKNYVGSAHMINKYTGETIELPKEVELHEKIENTYWMLHMGSWMGGWSKTLSFIASLIATSLPITGFIIWRGRRKKSKQVKDTDSTKRIRNHPTPKIQTKPKLVLKEKQ